MEEDEEELEIQNESGEEWQDPDKVSGPRIPFSLTGDAHMRKRN